MASENEDPWTAPLTCIEVRRPGPTPAPALNCAVWPRRFHLLRQRDPSGISGCGVVAVGVEFGDGQVVLRWLSRTPSTTIWAGLAEAMAVHGHNGLTTVVWLDGADAQD